jgi:hypothetical protein
MREANPLEAAHYVVGFDTEQTIDRAAERMQ